MQGLHFRQLGMMSVKKRLITIMVVEDDLKILGRIRLQILRMFNREVQVLEAKNFKEAEQIIEQGLIHIAIIDILLPDGNGEDLIKQVRLHSRHIPIIVQTTIEDMAYQLKIFKGYDRIKYLTKETLFNDLTKALFWAKEEVTDALAYRLAIPGKKMMDSLDANQVCYVMTILNSHHLHVELYDFEAKTYSTTEIKNMNLEQFMGQYNAIGIFLRCQRGFIVNKRMIEKLFKNDNEILMLYRGKGGKEIRIEVGGTYKKDVLAQLKGLY